MQELEIKLENCYGIKKLDKKFSFQESNVNLIYAKNGSMKTSFTKTFKKFQEGKEEEICDEIFGSEPIITEIENDGDIIDKDDIFVIKSFESSYESENISSLLINDELNRKLNTILSLKNVFLDTLVKKSGLKISRVSLGKTIFELEPQILIDFGLINKSFLQILNDIYITSISYDFSLIEYNSIFSDSIIKKIKKGEFQNNIQDFLNKSDEIYSMPNFSFLEKGKFTLGKLKDLQKKIKSNNFFVKNNKIVFDGNLDIENISILNDKIKEIETELHSTNEYKNLEKLFQDAGGMKLKDIIENNPDIVEELKLVNIENFRKKLWLSYIKKEEIHFNILREKYNELESEINSLNINETPWQDAVNIFNDRFSLPFKMEIDNLKSSVIGENTPKVAFNFCKDGDFSNTATANWKKLNRNELDKSDTLSQGEKRALYLLNIIFDIEKFKKEIENEPDKIKLFIVDDIADSFDYKNKYAIIEYLRDVSKIDNFKMIILSHNFDFYRTLSSRLSMSRENKFHIIKTINNEIKIKKEEYQGNPFDSWKEVLKAKTRYGISYTALNAKKYILALIPFIRNLIEYGVDKQVNTFTGIDKDYILLTSLFHLKEKTSDITIGDLKIIYKEYIGKDDFDNSLNNSDKILDLIFDISDNHIDYTDVKLENKIILAIAIRLKAEEYIKKEINNSDITFKWFTGWPKIEENGDKSLFLNYIENNGNQTAELFKGYEQLGNTHGLSILENVNIMTPENIHLNSFMYEPILDMDILELKELYKKVKEL